MSPGPGRRTMVRRDAGVASSPAARVSEGKLLGSLRERACHKLLFPGRLKGAEGDLMKRLPLSRPLVPA